MDYKIMKKDAFTVIANAKTESINGSCVPKLKPCIPGNRGTGLILIGKSVSR